ncbi:hypothetical protein E3N88_27384 [Mikania micrantha]|uniref:Retrotransposon gag domain-containing protein n=1 Tax=Mikania micrantha TaxID=192012 RepID=A0A5N6MWH3_9ASTR|nr:hypothetical protein E3N88_27384 [Mikania micrantha]
MSRFPGAVKKVQLLEFSGFNPQGWIQTANLYFDFNHTSDELHLTLVQFRMVGTTHHWFKVINQIWESITWPEFQSELLQRFSGFEIPNPYEQSDSIHDSVIDLVAGRDVEDTSDFGGFVDSVSGNISLSRFYYANGSGVVLNKGLSGVGQPQPNNEEIDIGETAYQSVDVKQYPVPSNSVV